MNHQDHTRGYEPVRPDEGRPRSRWRWWAVGLAGMTGLALATIGVAAPAADAVGRPLTSADEQPSADERRSGGEPGKGESGKGESGKGEPGKAESGKGDPGRGESGRGESDQGKGKKEPKPKGVPVPCDADKLIAAITLANARGGAVLDLAKKCTYLLTATIDDGAGLPVVTAPITLNGGKHTTIKRAAGVEEFRIVTVGTGGDLTLNHLTITGGQTDGDGGGILVNAGGALTTNHSTVTRNIAGSDGGGSSGGIANNGTTTIKHSAVSRNTAATAAGGIGNTGQLAIKKSSVTANMANAVVGGFGGGVGSFPGGTTVVTGSTISGNHAGDAGGGAGGFNANVTVTDTAITGNRASNGGAVFAEGGMLALRHVTVTNNTATLQGGGLSLQALNAATVATVADSTIAHNVGSLNGGGIVNAAIAFASTLDVRNTHITANQATFGGGIFNIAVDATVTLTNTKVIKNIAISTGGGILNSGGTVNLNTATGTVVVKNRPNNCVNVPGCVG